MRTALCTVLALLCACATQASADNVGAPAGGADAQHPPRQLTVTGTATLDLTPDVMDVRMQISAEAGRPKAAVALVRAHQAEVTAAVAKLHVGKDDLKLSQLSLSPTYDDHGNVRGYQATVTLTASSKDFDLLGDLAEAGAAAGATGLAASFRRSDLPAQKAHVRALAIEAAKAKAKQTAELLGFSLGPVDTVSEGTGDSWGYNGGAVNNVYSNATRTPASEVNPEASSLTLAVTVAFEIR